MLNWQYNLWLQIQIHLKSAASANELSTNVGGGGGGGGAQGQSSHRDEHIKNVSGAHHICELTRLSCLIDWMRRLAIDSSGVTVLLR